MILAEGMALRLSAVITTPYNCTTESLYTFGVCWAVALKPASKTMKQKREIRRNNFIAAKIQMVFPKSTTTS
jgi:hypothetical protein